MAYRTMELTLISAKDLKDVNLFSKMEVYAVVSIDGDARSRQRTTADHAGGSNPSWNSTLRFSLPPDDPARHVLHVLLRSERALGDRDVGEVHIPLKELLDSAVSGKGAPQFVSYQVRSPSSGKAKGILNLSYKIADAPVPAASAAAPWADVPVTAYPTGPGTAAAYPPPAKGPKADEPFTAYPAPGSGNGTYPPPAKAGTAEVPFTAYPAPAPGAGAAYPPPAKASKSDEPVTAYPARSSTGTSYPPPQGVAAPYPHPTGYPAYPQQYGYAGAPPPAGYGYPPPPPAGYGYPPAGYGYGAAQPAMAQPQKKNKFGMGLGAGLLGGALGGLLIGDLVSDAGDYDAGYDAGFDDGGGFGF